MSKKNRVPHHWTILIAVIILLGIGLRFYNYAKFPIPHETADEIAWTMVGASLLQEGVPTGWSYFNYPSKEEVHINGHFYPLVTPYLDHPPLFSLVPGSVQVVKRTSFRELLGFEWLRLPVVLLGCLNLWLFYLLTRHIFSAKKEQALAVLLFAVAPSVVFGSRLIVAENLLITWMLILMILALKLKKQGRSHWLGLATISILMILTKIAGIAIIAGIGIYLFLQKQYAALKPLLVGALAGILSLLAYANFYDLSLFLSVQTQQSGFRHQSLITPVFSLFVQPEVVNSLYFDGFLATGFIALVVLAAGKKTATSQLILSLSSLYLLFVSVAVGATIGAPESFVGGALYGWYLYPLYPLFVLAVAQLLIDLKARHQPFLLLLLILVGLFPLVRLAQVFTIGQSAQLHVFPKQLIWALGGLVGLSLVAPERFWKHILIGWLVVLVVVSAIVIVAITPEAYISNSSYLESL